MPPKKLSETDKQEILDRYRSSEETTVTLATQYGVSTSTISRILKQSLPEAEYESLVQRKRQGGKAQLEQDLIPGLTDELDEPADFDLEPELEIPVVTPQRRQRKRSTAGMISAEQLAASAAHLSQLELAPSIKKPTEFELTIEPLSQTLSPVDSLPEVGLTTAVEDDLEEDLEDDDDDLEDDLDDLDDDDLDDLDDDEFDEAGTDDLAEAMPIASAGLLQILPLAEASIPKTCYVVVDRSSELITRPLKDFAELGQIPTDEVQERTLPIFDNHRVAKRFLRRMQRIVKLPDGRILQKVKPYLQAKGITHLLIDGQVYSLQ